MESSKALNVFPLQIMVIGKEEIIEGEIVRTKAPRTVERILAKLPLTRRATKQDDQVIFTIDIKMGNEKPTPTKTVKQGEIVYWPMGDSISFILEDTELYGGCTTIGKINSNLDVFKKLRLSVTLKINKK